MGIIWWIIIILLAILLIYRIVRAMILTSSCKKILKMQKEKLKEEGLITEV